MSFYFVYLYPSFIYLLPELLGQIFFICLPIRIKFLSQILTVFVNIFTFSVESWFPSNENWESLFYYFQQTSSSPLKLAYSFLFNLYLFFITFVSVNLVIFSIIFTYKFENDQSIIKSLKFLQFEAFISNWSNSSSPPSLQSDSSPRLLFHYEVSE